MNSYVLWPFVLLWILLLVDVSLYERQQQMVYDDMDGRLRPKFGVRRRDVPQFCRAAAAAAPGDQIQTSSGDNFTHYWATINSWLLPTRKANGNGDIDMTMTARVGDQVLIRFSALLYFSRVARVVGAAKRHSDNDDDEQQPILEAQQRHGRVAIESILYHDDADHVLGGRRNDNNGDDHVRRDDDLPPPPEIWTRLYDDIMRPRVYVGDDDDAIGGGDNADSDDDDTLGELVDGMPSWLVKQVRGEVQRRRDDRKRLRLAAAAAAAARAKGNSTAAADGRQPKKQPTTCRDPDVLFTNRYAKVIVGHVPESVVRNRSSGVVPGLFWAVEGMCINERRIVVIDANWAFGNNETFGNRVAPNDIVEFHLVALNIERPRSSWLDTVAAHCEPALEPVNRFFDERPALAIALRYLVALPALFGMFAHIFANNLWPTLWSFVVISPRQHCASSSSSSKRRRIAAAEAIVRLLLCIAAGAFLVAVVAEQFKPIVNNWHLEHFPTHKARVRR
jgi:FKBP-type peptidyl-prolyl cis-trans isomerase